MQPRDRRIYRITLAGSIVNVVLLVFKFAAGILGHSAAMIADAIHSLSDFLTDIIVIVFVRLSSKPADRDHDYGHGKYETLATSVIGLALAVVAVLIGWDGIEKIADALQGNRLESPGIIALWAAQHRTQGMDLPCDTQGGRRGEVEGSRSQRMASPK